MNFEIYKDLFLAIDGLISKKERVCIAIDGGAGSGKTTLAQVLAQRYGAAVIHMDDFFLRMEQRTPQRFAEPGGNFDRERFLSEVIPYLPKKERFSYRRFDCSTMSLGDMIEIPAAPLIITEGSYSHHPLFWDSYDLRVFLSISEEKQRARILERNGERSEMFFSRWIPLERAYFDAYAIRENADLVIRV